MDEAFLHKLAGQIAALQIQVVIMRSFLGRVAFPSTILIVQPRTQLTDNFFRMLLGDSLKSGDQLVRFRIEPSQGPRQCKEHFSGNSMLDFLNQNSGALMVIFTAVVTLSTAVYAILTACLVAETRRMRRAQTDAKIEIVLKPSEEWIQLVNLYIRNIGLGPAYDLSFDINPETMTEGTRQLVEDFTKANFLKSGLKYLGPGQEVVSRDSQMNENFEQKMSSVLHFMVHYKSATGKQHQERFRIDFSELRGFSRIGTPPLYVIARSLEKIESAIHNAFSGSSRIKADIFTEEDRRREKKEWEEYREQGIGQKNVKPPDS